MEKEKEKEEGQKEEAKPDLRDVINESKSRRKRSRSRSRSASRSRSRSRSASSNSSSGSDREDRRKRKDRRKFEEVGESRKYEDEDKQKRYEEFKERQRMNRNTNVDGGNKHNRDGGSSMVKIGSGHEHGKSYFLKQLRNDERRQQKSDLKPCKCSAGFIVFASGLHEESSKEDLEDRFGEYGFVKHLDLPRDRKTGLAKGYAMVSYEHSSDGQSAIDDLNNTKVYGSKISVGWAFLE